MGNWIVGHPSFVEPDRLAVEVVRESLVGGWRIAERAGGQCHATDKVLVQLALKPKTHANARAIAIRHVLLEETLAAHTNVARPPETPKGVFKGGDAFLIVLGFNQFVLDGGL